MRYSTGIFLCEAHGQCSCTVVSVFTVKSVKKHSVSVITEHSPVSVNVLLVCFTKCCNDRIVLLLCFIFSFHKSPWARCYYRNNTFSIFFYFLFFCFFILFFNSIPCTWTISELLLKKIHQMINRYDSRINSTVEWVYTKLASYLISIAHKHQVSFVVKTTQSYFEYNVVDSTIDHDEILLLCSTLTWAHV